MVATDLTVINATKEYIEVREVTFNHESWAKGTSEVGDTAYRGELATGLMSEWLKNGEIEGINPPPKKTIE